MKVQCLMRCKNISEDTEWVETDFFCEDCGDDHTGVQCPNPKCDAIDGPGTYGRREIDERTIWKVSPAQFAQINDRAQSDPEGLGKELAQWREARGLRPGTEIVLKVEPTFDEITLNITHD